MVRWSSSSSSSVPPDQKRLERLDLLVFEPRDFREMLHHIGKDPLEPDFKAAADRLFRCGQGRLFRCEMVLVLLGEIVDPAGDQAGEKLDHGPSFTRISSRI